MYAAAALIERSGMLFALVGNDDSPSGRACVSSGLSSSGPSSNAPTCCQTPTSAHQTHNTHSIPQCSRQPWRSFAPCPLGDPQQARSHPRQPASPRSSSHSHTHPTRSSAPRVASQGQQTAPSGEVHRWLVVCAEDERRLLAAPGMGHGSLGATSPRRPQRYLAAPARKKSHAHFSIVDSTSSRPRRTDDREPESLLAFVACCNRSSWCAETYPTPC